MRITYESTFASYYLLPFLSRFPTSENHHLAILRSRDLVGMVSENVTRTQWLCKSHKTQRLGIKRSLCLNHLDHDSILAKIPKNPQKKERHESNPPEGSIRVYFKGLTTTWNLKHPFINGCFTKHPLETGCFGFQVSKIPVVHSPSQEGNLEKHVFFCD